MRVGQLSRKCSLILMVFCILCSGCNGGSINVIVPGTPEYTVSRFANTMKDGNSDRAIDFICMSDFLTILPTLNYSWSKDGYTLLAKDDYSASVRMKGESKITEEDWKRWSEDLQTQIPQFFSARISLDYTWTLVREEDGWCIAENELGDFVEYFIGKILNEIPQ